MTTEGSAEPTSPKPAESALSFQQQAAMMAEARALYERSIMVAEGPLAAADRQALESMKPPLPRGVTLTKVTAAKPGEQAPPTRVQVQAAKLREITDLKQGKQTPDWVKKIAASRGQRTIRTEKSS